MPFFSKLIFLVFFIALAVVLAFILVYRRRKDLVKKLEMKLFVLRIPQSRIELSEELFRKIVAFGKPIVFEAAIPYFGIGLTYYAAVPAEIASAFLQAVRSIWPNAGVDEIDDYSIFNYTGFSVGGWVRAQEKEKVTIKTYEALGTDAFGRMIDGLREVNEIGEGGAIQIIIRGTPKKGEELEMNMRIIASAPSQLQADAIFDAVKSGFGVFKTPKGNPFMVMRAKNVEELASQFSARRFDDKKKIVLSTKELATVFHLPVESRLA